MLTVRLSSNNAKYLKFHHQKVESARNGKLWRLSRRFQTLIWRPGETFQNLESPGLSGRVDRPAINNLFHKPFWQAPILKFG